ncbi:efflux RND transporter periplasmic adaptor subunit [Mobilitalea sibirica]|uniref:Efflux RND transporter periplasmic adaptor subunit n=1 Tax=Mobilitalea sibirica TaxID=1462919 RepID=A0A8J7KXJ7_9FIRM|nr:efflux RND transporter periplasmic adaptor subunit [Mobilitalea sibirica]MBH1941862.1 efflux RND transporter periplasmic adaptor subunit [Mobilitalea sibirica]
MSRKKKVLLHIGAYALIIMVLFSLFSEQLSGDELVTVTTVTSQKGTFYEDITFSGAIDFNVKTVHEAPFFLEIDEVFLPAGTLVKEGDVVASCEGYQVEKSILQMESALQTMKNELKVLKEGFSGITDPDQKRALEIQIRLKEIAVEEAQADFDLVKQSFNENFELIARVDGKLTIQNLAEGRQVATGDVLFEIADPETMEAVFTSPASQEEYVKLGDKITVEVIVYKRGENLDWVRDNQALKLEVKSKKIEAGICTYKADIAPDKNERIDPQQLQVSMTLPTVTYSRLLPHGSIQREMGSSYIYVVNTVRRLFNVEHYVEKLEVNVMDSNEYYTAVSGETLTGYNIVYTANGPLKNGQRVRIED